MSALLAMLTVHDPVGDTSLTILPYLFNISGNYEFDNVRHVEALYILYIHFDNSKKFDNSATRI